MVALFILVIAGLYFGFFAPSEAGTIGAFGALVIALVRRRMPWTSFLTALLETARTSCFILITLVGAMLFNTFLTMTGLPQAASQWITTLPVPPFVTMIIILFFYIPLGMLIEGMAMLLLTIPFVFPIIQGFGYDPVWFGVIMCVLVEFSLISPPVAINLYVVQGVTKVPLHEVARGIVPFIAAYLFCLVLLIIFPQISLFLPGTMK